MLNNYLMDSGDISQDADNPYNQLKNFLIEKKIGKGQFSEVYRAACTVNGRPVALKKVQVRHDIFFVKFLHVF